MKVEKVAQVANFNVVIGDEESPMLDYFDSFIYPAFTSDVTRKEADAEYMFKGVQIVKNMNDEYVLVGKLAKKTILEVYSDINPNGELVEKDEKHPSAPYSTFAIYLKNHRMVLVPNQKGSPTLASFRKTVSNIFCEYRRRINQTLEEEKKIPELIVKVVGIPTAKSMKEALKTVEKVNELKLRFYPLNGDIDFSGLFGTQLTDLRKAVGSKRGEAVFKSPKNIDGVSEVIEAAAGTVEPIITVTTKEKSKLKIKETEITEKFKIKINEDIDFEAESKEVVKETEALGIIKFSNTEHDNIYQRNVNKVEKFFAEK